jgi:hypothetical protein
MSQRYAFIAEWLDPNSGVLWRYQLFYYKDTNELEMVRARLNMLVPQLPLLLPCLVAVPMRTWACAQASV